MLLRYRNQLTQAQLAKIEPLAAVIPHRQLNDGLFKYDLLEGIFLSACVSDIEALTEIPQVDDVLEMNFYDENDC